MSDLVSLLNQFAERGIAAGALTEACRQRGLFELLESDAPDALDRFDDGVARVLRELVSERDPLALDPMHAGSPIVRLHLELQTGADAFLAAAAGRGLFSEEVVKRYPRTSARCRVSVQTFVQRDYVVRQAEERDLARLFELERLCWQHTQTPDEEIQARLRRYPQGHFVLEKDGVVLGVIYSQRIASLGALAARTAASVHELHDDTGSIVQLLAVNIDPRAQNASYGDQLLEFMLQRCSLLTGIEQVVGVTLCKAFGAARGESFDRYIERQGADQDPVLTFHQAHGAEIVGAVPGYRPEDEANQHNGVLVAYDILHRVPRASAVSERNGNATHLDRRQIRDSVEEDAARLLRIERSELDADRPLMEMGLDSADLLKLQRQCEARFGLELPAAFFFEQNSLRKVVDALAARLAGETLLAPSLSPQTGRGDMREADIAIVGMSCKLPGGIETPEDLWRVLASGECVIGAFPTERRDWPDGEERGGFVRDADAFDAPFFRISPAEAEVTDPQQRMLLELTWTCLEDAGIVPQALAGSNTGVFVGASNCDYSRLIQEAGATIEAHHGVGSSLAILANRLSYFFDFSGPSLLIDTACSSSLVALHAAVQSLRSGECSTALAGGVNLICHPDLSIAYRKAGMLAPDGTCKVFDAKADGYVRAEGAVVLLLKPLQAALADRNRVHAVIRGTATNHGGLAGGLTVPNPQKQSELLLAAWNDGALAADQLTYIEAHGTGTPLGDPIELQGIQTAHATLRAGAASLPCGIGSIKSNLGHLESAAGLAGLLKVVLSFQHKQLPATIHYSELNPKIRLTGTPFFIQDRLRDWEAQPRIAAVSSFGSGGTNAHVVLQEYADESAPVPQDGDQLFVLSAATAERLRSYAGRVLDWLRRDATATNFADAIFTWQTGRTAMKHRLALVVKDHLELRERLQSWLATPLSPQRSAEPHSSSGLQQLAAVWTAGGDVDWRELYANRQMPRCISVPSYPFARERHWIGRIAHPFLHAKSPDRNQLRYHVTFSGDEFFLVDHRIGGQQLLPGVACLEMARAAIEHARPARAGRSWELRDTVWVRPVAVSARKQVRIALSENGDRIDYEISGYDAGERVIHCQGSAILCEAIAPSRLEIGTLLPAGRDVEPERVYTACAGRGLAYGPSFRSITAIREDRGQLLVNVRLPDAVEHTAHDYVLHPSVMDAALQACVGFLDDVQEPRLPFALESLRIVAPCATEMVAWVRNAPDSRPDSRSGSDVVKRDIDLCDHHGNVCVQLRGFSSRVSRDLDTRAPLQAYVPVWNPVRPNANAMQAESVLFLGDDSTSLDWVRDSCANAASLSLPSATSIDDLADALRSHAFDRIVWMTPDASSADLIAQQERGVLALFRIIKALLMLGYGDRDLRWTIVTGPTQAVTPDERVQPEHAAIAGLVGSLAKEVPHWHITLLDVDSLASVTARECLSMPADPRGNVLARRGGEWFRQEFAVIAGASETSPFRYRHDGVYVVIGGAGGLGEVWSRVMIERYQARVIWIGRQERNAAIDAKIESLRAFGEAPLYIRADATNAEALQGACEAIRQTHPAIHGVVHSALVLDDSSLANMDEAKFRAGLAAKVDVAANLDRVFGGQALDFMLFFSSMMSFLKPAGQSNYAAGCTFADSFARSLQQRRAYPVKIMNWGYWGQVGIVASGSYNQAMERTGIGAIEPAEGMAALERFVASPRNQLGLIRLLDPGAVVDLKFSETLTQYPKTSEDAQVSLAALEELQVAPPASTDGGLQTPDLDDLLAEILAATLFSLGLLNDTAAPQSLAIDDRWLASSRRELRRRNLDESERIRPLADLWQEWDVKKDAWAANRDRTAQVGLLDACLRALAGILTGRERATDIVFPRASMQLVEGVYRDNALSDYFNDILASTLSTCLERLVHAQPDREIRILEIGAGTGGSTVRLLPLLERFRVAEYCYSDVSRAFLMHAEERYQPQYPFLRTAIFDVTKPLAGQNVDANRYDIVVATNVLHATPNIREALRNAKAVLTNQGVLLLNEVSRWSLFSHLTFGLLEGWWLHEDGALRLPGTPALGAEQWRSVLAGERFDAVAFPVRDAHALGQQIIAARSDGAVRQRRVETIVVSAPAAAVFPIAPPSPVVAEPGHSLRDRGISYFQTLIASTLKMRPHDIDPRQPLAEYGLDSILIGQLTYQLRKVFSEIAGTLFFEVQTLDALVDYFLDYKEQELADVVTPRNVTPARELPATEPPPVHVSEPALAPAVAPHAVFDVAIIGVSGRYPKSPDLRALWRNLAEGVNCITEIPKDRWNWEDYYDAGRTKPGTMYTKFGGFLDEIDRFDPLFFRIAPKDAKRMDPQERIFVEACYHAIEDAGYTPANLDRVEKIGVFVGVMNGRYTPQPAHYSIANRVSYLFNFQGPSMAVDTACSSSLTAVHVALESLYSGLSACAIAGGVNLIIDPVHYLELTELTMLSSGDRCKAFGEQADGFVDAEGVGAIVLKPLMQAQADGDHIYAVIKGSAINAGGRTTGYTVPNPNAQAKVVSLALQRAKVSAADMSYVEAHGTGTALGDPIELAGLTRAFRETTDATQFCAIGSFKSNAGHSESAAGIGGLTKVLLQLKHATLVPSLHAEVLNPELDFAKTPFRIQRTLEEWRRPVRTADGVTREIPRIAGISSFGAGGANAHVIVQEYPQPADPRIAVDENVAIVLSARTTEQLAQKATDLLAFLRDARRTGDAIDLAAIAYTLQVGREPMDERLGFFVRSVEQFEETLQSYLSGNVSGAILRGQTKRNNRDEQPLLRDAVTEADFASGALEKLLVLWVEGQDLDWRRLYGEARPRRMSLPVYPFARERYWIEPARDNRSAPQSTAATVLHPLLHRNTSDFRQQSYSTTFRGDEPFLSDRDGLRVLPAGVCLEMARAAVELAAASNDGASIDVRDVVWAEPVVIAQTTEVCIALLARSANEIHFEIYTSEGGQDVIHCQGAAMIGRNAQDASEKHPSTAVAVSPARTIVAAPLRREIAFAPQRKSERLPVDRKKPSIALSAPGALLATPADASRPQASGRAPIVLAGTAPASAQSASSAIRLYDDGDGRFSIEITAPSPDAIGDLPQALAAIQAEPAIKVLRIAGIAHCFESAADHGPASREKLFEAIAAFPDPTIAVLHHGAMGDAFLFAALCDFMVCDEDSSYSYGRECNAAESALLRERFGVGAVLDGANLTGRELRAKGWTCAFVPGSEVDAAANTLAASLAQKPQESLRLLKQHMSRRFPMLVAALASGDKLDRIAEPLPTLADLVEGERSIDSIESVATPIGLRSSVVSAMAYADGVVVVTMQDRQAKNMFSDAFVAGVREVFARIEREPSYKAVVLTGYDSYFASGGTKEILLAIQEGKAKFTDYEIVQLALDCTIPVIAAMQGHGIGAGWTLGMFADFILLSEESQYVSPYMSYGFTPGAGATWILNETLGPDLARESLFTARHYSGRELRERGAALTVLPRAEVRSAALTLARRIARLPRALLTARKSQRIAAVRETLEETYRLELAMHDKTFVGRADTLAQIESRFESEPESAKPTPVHSTAHGNGSESLATIAAALKTLLANELQMRESDVDENAQFVDLGLDSISGVTWVRKINQKYQTSIEATKVYSHPTLTQLSRFVKAEAERDGVLSKSVAPVTLPAAVPPPAAAPETRPAQKLVSLRNRATSRFVPDAPAKRNAEAIAVIGMAGRFPNAKDLGEYWQNIAGGLNCISQVPVDRWDLDAYYQPGDPVEGKTNSQWMGALEDVDRFDPLFFNISPTEAESMDPQQRLFLQTCWHTIENAGYAARALSGSKCGVFVGCTNGDYQLRSRTHRWSAQGFTGSAMSILAARISYFLNLQGPCVSIDTACSSSLVAIAQACDSLITGGSDLALAGGVSVMTGPEMHIKTAQAGMLSPEGKCFTFDQRADGFVPGEGVGVILLKRLADAQRDGDIIHGLIEGWGVNQDGKTNGITAPNPESQTRLQQDVYDRCGIDPAAIQLVEAHGTGTKLGDPIEVEGLKNAFRKYTQDTEYCALGSVKSNIGHSLTAAGIAGVLKLLLAIEHKQLPPTINFERLNEHIDLGGSPFYINDRLRDWIPGGNAKRQGAISSFGFSGTNAHMVIGEFLPPAERSAVTTLGPNVIVPLSAKTSEQLLQQAHALLDYVRTHTSTPLDRIAYTLQTGREPMDERLAVLAGSVEELATSLQASIDGTPAGNLHRGSVKQGKESLSLFAHDDDMKETIVSRWIAQNKLERLQEAWVKGLDLDWSQLYSERKPKRVALPGYPFARERYWIDVAAADTQRGAALLHPLVHRNTSDLKEQRFSSTFSGDEFFLRDHRVRIDGRIDGGAEKVLPGVAYLEMARAAIAQASPEQAQAQFELRDVAWLRPSIVAEPRELSVALFLNVRDEIGFEIYSRHDESETVHCQGRAAFHPRAIPARLDLHALAARMQRGRTEGPDLYRRLASLGLIYGPAHRGIAALHLGDQELLAQLQLPAIVAPSQHEYVLHPSVMDSALQATIGLAVGSSESERPPVPFALDSLRVVSHCTSEMFAWLRPSQGSQLGSRTTKLDLDLCDAQGNVCVQLQGFVSRAMKSDAEPVAQLPVMRLADARLPILRGKSEFNAAFYQKLIADVASRELSVDEALHLG